jgi:septal ring factor EnvC (AmiA/AmiB activator)
MNIEAMISNLNEERTKIVADLSRVDEERRKISGKLRRIKSAIKALSGSSSPRPMPAEQKQRISAALKAKAAQKRQANTPASLDFKSSAANDKATVPVTGKPSSHR